MNTVGAESSPQERRQARTPVVLGESARNRRVPFEPDALAREIRRRRMPVELFARHRRAGGDVRVELRARAHHAAAAPLEKIHDAAHRAVHGECGGFFDEHFHGSAMRCRGECGMSSGPRRNSETSLSRSAMIAADIAASTSALPLLAAELGGRDRRAEGDPDFRAPPREPVLRVVEPLAAEDHARDDRRARCRREERQAGAHRRAVHDRSVAVANSRPRGKCPPRGPRRGA